MSDYSLQYPGATIDALLGKVNNPDSSPTANSNNLVKSGGVKAFVEAITGQLANLNTTAKDNLVAAINEAAQSEGGDVVKYSPQALTEEQKAQARANIDAASLADIEDMDFVTAASLPTASASTMGHIYLIGPDANNNYDRYFTQESGGAYSWVSLGSTKIDLSTYATKAELSQLEAEVHNLSGKFYGVFADNSDLPEGDAVGYAFVGSANPYAIWNFDGEEWSDSGSVVNGIHGEPGVGFSSIFTPSPYDGTMIIVLSDGNTITVDLNHDHLGYPKYMVCTQAEYDAIITKDSDMLYLIPEA